jgi:GDP-mannose 6-dehydrogenase
MRIAVFGLGYVGCVTGACLARLGHQVCGVDISPLKVRILNDGHSPVTEKGLERLIAQVTRQGNLRASLKPSEAMQGAEVSMVCVGTPSRAKGQADVSHVLHAARDIGRALPSARRFHTVVIRSTVPPGTVESQVIPLLERHSGKRAGRDFGVCFQPEFLREGSSLADFFHPPLNVLGCLDARSAKRLVELWRPLNPPPILTSPKVAEMLKYASNAFHALKVAFANEIGALSKSLGIDSREVMQIFVQDKKLNISPLYLEPGFAFGGPCLPKDLRALCHMARLAQLDFPLLSSVLRSNTRHMERALERIFRTGKKRIGILGLVFKSETDDLRESPAAALVRRLIQAGREVGVYDPRVQLGKLLGANRAFVEKELPQLPELLRPSWRELLAWSEVVVVAGAHPEFSVALCSLKKRHILVDLIMAPSVTSKR